MDGKPVPEAKTDLLKLVVAYGLLMVGGAFGFHLAFLGRQNQAIVWSMTFGMFGFGFLRDIFTIPRYVREATGEECKYNYATGLDSRHHADCGRFHCSNILDSASGAYFAASNFS